MTPSSNELRPRAVVPLLAALAMFGPFTIDTFFPAFAEVAASLNANPWQMQQTISAYLLGYALMSFVHGPVSDAHGRRRVILFGVSSYILASIVCTLAPNIETLLIARFWQGCSTGAGMIVGRAIIRDRFHGGDAQRVMAWVSMLFGIAPALAPLVGAFIHGFASWRAIFAFMVVYGALMLWACIRVLPETHPPERRTPLHPRALLATYRRIGMDRAFVLWVGAAGLFFGGQFIYISSAPVFIEQFLGLGTYGYAWYFVPTIVGMTVGSALSARLAAQTSPARCTNIGLLVMIAGQAINLAYNAVTEHPAVPWAVLPFAIYGCGVSLATPPMNVATLDRHPLHRGAAASVQSAMWSLMMVFVSGFAAPLAHDSPMHLALGSFAFWIAGALCLWIGPQIVFLHVPTRADAAESELGEPV
ncbi:MAG TPA: multidrug effflux MFS transporter [Pseudomonadota bacterium]|nr:multidrug effflux MFS transporter [Rhodanobacteraceae bacterium]MBP9153804.1 multidrug effflux MFS transporter [Xanthomonadales bacterium]HQW82301.1 multidrug effflux MFS transporter [Pseudomonadota bacterium]